MLVKVMLWQRFGNRKSVRQDDNLPSLNKNIQPPPKPLSKWFLGDLYYIRLF